MQEAQLCQPFGSPALTCDRSLLMQVLQAVKDIMLEKCGKAELAVCQTEHFPAVIPDPVRFLKTEEGWRL